MGNSQSSENGSGGSGGNTWDYTPSDGGNGTTSDAVWQGAKQGWNEFWKNPITETAKAADGFQSAGKWSDAFSGKN